MVKIAPLDDASWNFKLKAGPGEGQSPQQKDKRRKMKCRSLSRPKTVLKF